MNAKTKSQLMLIPFVLGTLTWILTLGFAYASYGAVPIEKINIIPIYVFVVSSIGFAISISSIFLAKHFEGKIVRIHSREKK